MRVPKEKSDATRERLITVAREHFTQQGYAAAATEEIVQQAGVTRGALYHHFGSKQGLFRAVLEAVHSEVGRRVVAAAEAAGDPWQALVTGSAAFLEVATAPDVRRIMLLDGPSVLGWSAWRELDARYSMKELRDHLETLKEAGILRPVSTDALTCLLSGAMNEVALWIAEQPDPTLALSDTMAVLKVMMDGLRVRTNRKTGS